MKPISKRLFSLLLAVVLVLGLPSQAMAATIVGSSETTVTQPTDATEPVSTEASDPTEPVEPEETTVPTEAPEETTTPTEPQAETEPVDAADTTDPTDPTEPTEPPAEDEEETGLIITPDPIVAENPYDPDWPYPYGLPVDNDFPDDLLEVDPYGIALMADMSLIPDEMYDNYILRALEYTGYDVQKMKDNGWLYVAQYTSSNINSYAPEVLSDIGYDDYSPFLNGDETVADSSTVTGRAPDIASFEASGLVCASFVSYYWNNYLPNIEGIDTTWISDAIKATTMNGGSYSTASVWAWETGLTNLANTAGSGVTKYTDADTAYANLVPGDLIVFSNSSGSLTHIAVYAGTYTMYNASGTNRGPYHYIIHVGNSRGPEISAVEYMVSSGSKSSSPSAWYHIDLPEVQSTGYIEVYKTDPNGKDLSGAYFTAVDQATGDKYVIGPTDANGYAKSGELPLGTYVVTETVFPEGYGPSGTTRWTVTLTEDTPDGKITINAVNELTTGSAKIVKATTNGGSKAGWHFEVKDSSGTVVGTYVTDDTGVIVVDLVPGTYTVTETDGAYKYWVNDPNPSRTVTVKADETATVTFTNQWRGQAQIVKTTTNGGTVAGWHFTVKNSSGTVIGNYVTDSTGVITLDLDPGTYTVTETDGAIQYWENDPNPTRTVTVKAGETAKVTFENQHKGEAQIICKYEDIPLVQEVVRQLRHNGAKVNSSCGIHIHVDASRHSPQTLRNIVNIMASKEDLLYKTLKVESWRELQYCKKADLRFLDEVNTHRPKTMEQIERQWYNGESGRNDHYDNSRYHALNLHSVFSKGTIEFRMFNSTLHAGEVKSYIQLCLAISHQALVQRTASRSRTQSSNEKYTFRTWLLRLGMIGDEFKTARQHLLKNLDGNIAWRDPAQAEAQRERQLQQRLEQLSQTCSSAVGQEQGSEQVQEVRQQEEEPAISMEM